MAAPRITDRTTKGLACRTAYSGGVLSGSTTTYEIYPTGFPRPPATESRRGGLVDCPRCGATIGYEVHSVDDTERLRRPWRIVMWLGAAIVAACAVAAVIVVPTAVELEGIDEYATYVSMYLPALCGLVVAIWGWGSYRDQDGLRLVNRKLASHRFKYPNNRREWLERQQNGA